MLETFLTPLVTEGLKTTRSNRLKFRLLCSHKKANNALFFIALLFFFRWGTPHLRTDFKRRQTWPIAFSHLQPSNVGVHRWKREISFRIQASPRKAWVYRCSSETCLFYSRCHFLQKDVTCSNHCIKLSWTLPYDWLMVIECQWIDLYYIRIGYPFLVG